MISERIKQHILATESTKIKAIADYKTWLQANGFTLSKAFDFKALAEELKMKLFDGLLKNDKSTAYRFGLLKDIAAKQVFINDKINLAGYPELDSIRGFISAIGDGLNVNDYGVYLDDLLATELDVNKALDAQLIDWKGETVYDDMQRVAKSLYEAFELFRKYAPGEYDTPLHFLHELRHSGFSFDYATDGTFEANEMKCAYYLAEKRREAKLEAEHLQLKRILEEKAKAVAALYKKK